MMEQLEKESCEKYVILNKTLFNSRKDNYHE